MKRVRSFVVMAVIVMIGMSSCSKTGDTGPAGPTGPVGPVGAAGPDSVLYSAWITLTATAINDSTYQATVTAPALTQSVLDNAVILSYVNFGSATDPDVVPTASLGGALLEDFTVGTIYLTAGSDLNKLLYRYVIIPGSLVTGNSADKEIKGYTTAELKAMPYSKVQQVLADKN